MPAARENSGCQEPGDDVSVLDVEAKRAIPFGVAGDAPVADREASEPIARRSADLHLGRRASGSPTESQTRPLARALRRLAPRHLLGRPGSWYHPCAVA